MLAFQPMAEQPIAQRFPAHAKTKPLGQPMLELLRCDSCNKPLGDGALKRGDASDRGGVIVCASCEALEAKGYALPISPSAEGKAKFKNFHAKLHESAIYRIKDAETAPLDDEPDTEPLPQPVSDAVQVVGPDGKALSARVVRAADGSMRVELVGDAALLPRTRPSPSSPQSPSKAKRKDHDTEPTAPIQAAASARLPAPRQASRAALARRIDIETQAAKRARGFSTTAALLFLGVVLSSLGFAIYIALDTQRKANEAQLRADDNKSEQAPRTFNQVPLPDKTSAQPVGNQSEERASDAPKATSFPVELPKALENELGMRESAIAAPIIEMLSSNDLDTRLNGIAQAMRDVAVAAAPHIQGQLQSEH
ncbi:MAG: hypothetical protein KDB07_03150, partial [Planctomycetes bacterium]|nr:hypothetical protein [Planctomycetota bacterium]